MIPDLPVIPDTTDVIVDISRQSLRVASLIHEYTKFLIACSFIVGRPRIVRPNLADTLRSSMQTLKHIVVKINVDGGNPLFGIPSERVHVQ